VFELYKNVHLWRRGFLAYSTVFGGEHVKAVSVGLFKWYAYEDTNHVFPCRCGILYCCAHDGYDMIRCIMILPSAILYSVD
jgi:hypothetical protein